MVTLMITLDNTVWQANLMNEQCFTKLKSAKSFHPIHIYLGRKICRTFLLPKSYWGKFTQRLHYNNSEIHRSMFKSNTNGKHV